MSVILDLRSWVRMTIYKPRESEMARERVENSGGKSSSEILFWWISK